MTPAEKPIRRMTNVRFTDAEREMIERLKERYGIGRIADLVRFALHRLDEQTKAPD